MNLRIAIFTTSKDTWFSADFPTLKVNLENARGVKVDQIDTFFIHPNELTDIPLTTDSDGDTKFDWDWFKETFTAQARGYNAVILHISREEKKRLGITVNGTYRRDPDEIFECWISADKGQRAQQYDMSEWLRLAIHELGGHGFERFVYGYDTNYTHQYDYHLKRLPALTSIMDFAEWDILQSQRDLLLGIKLEWVRRLYQKLFTFKRMIDRPIYPIAEDYFRLNKVSQGFGVRNPHYASGVHPGTDFLCPVGTEIVAPADGTVIQYGQDHRTLGGHVYFTCLIDGVRYWMRFLHLSKAMPRGAYKKGDSLGITGNSGDSTGAHLHLDVWNRSIDARLIGTAEGVRKHLLDPAAFFKEQVDGIVTQ